MYLGNGLAGTLTNTSSGTISATATAHGTSASAYGVKINNNLSGTLINQGQITASATAAATTDSAEAEAYGVYISNSLTGSLHNSGHISATAVASSMEDSSATATAYGVYISLDLSSAETLSNSGHITATATATNTSSSSAEAYARGVRINNELAGALTNTSTGSIAAIANAAGTEATASAAGVMAGNGTISGTLTNQGQITATASATTDSAEAYAYGVRANAGLSGILNNSGHISANATADSTDYTAYAYAYGLELGTLSGTLANSGHITASASSTTPKADAYAYGVRIQNWDGYNPIQAGGVLENSGTISGTAPLPEHGYSLYVSADGGEGGLGAINNQAGGMLHGNLFIDSSLPVTNSGIISIPAMPLTRNEANVTAGRIDGNYTQNVNGTLRIGALSTSNYGRLTVNGTAVFAPNTTIDVDVDPESNLQKDAVLTSVISTPTLSPDTSFNVTDNWALFDFDDIIHFNQGEGNDTVDLIVINSQSFVKATTNLAPSSALGAAGALDNLRTSDSANPVLGLFAGLATTQEVADAVLQSAPALNTELSKSTSRTRHGTKHIILARQSGNPDDSRGMNSGDLLFADRNIWLSPFGSWAEQENTDITSGYDADSYGLVLGADGNLGSNKYRLGAALAISQTDVEGKNSIARQSADADSYQAILYGNYSLDDSTNWTWQGDYALHQNTINRAIPFANATARGEFDGWSAHLGTGLDRRYALCPQTSLIPAVRVDYTYLRDESYSETGAGALSLNVDGKESEELLLGVEGKLTHTLDKGRMLTANVGVSYDMIDDNNSSVSSFAGAPSVTFVTPGNDPSPWLTNAGVGMILGSLDTVLLTARYDIQGREDYINQSVSLKLKRSF